MKKVSFDFDGTLSMPHVKKYAKSLVEKGYEVWIVTSRVGDDNLKKTFYKDGPPNWNDDLWETAEEIGIPKNQVKFTEFVDKIDFLKEKNFIFHLDDDEYELMAILNSKDSCKAININYFDWENCCNELI